MTSAAANGSALHHDITAFYSLVLQRRLVSSDMVSSAYSQPFQAAFSAVEYKEDAAKRPCRPFGTKPDTVSSFIGILALMDAVALLGIAKPARASASISASIPMNAETIFGFVPEGPQGLLGASSIIQQPKMLLWLASACRPHRGKT